ncbi:MAG TPA: DUF427 domain-containing protein [Caulobacteraceae bacterium]|nr:DUF427 domain-containing protein [Caulobacteraceae bacterium]
MNAYGQASPFHVTACPQRVRALFEGHELADSDDVMVLGGGEQPDAFYFPIKDVQMSSLRPNHRLRHVEGLGDAQFYTIMRDGHVIEDVAWCFGEPVADTEGIGGRIAFDPRHVDFQLETAPEDRVVRHVPAHDPPYADDLDPMDSREIPSETGAHR